MRSGGTFHGFEWGVLVEYSRERSVKKGEIGLETDRFGCNKG